MKMYNNKIKTSSSGTYFGRYKAKIDEYQGIDPSKRCIIFAGQGGASPGMLKEYYNNHQIVKDIFMLADKLAKNKGLSPISHFITKPNNIPIEFFYCYQNLCLFTLEVAIFNVLKKKNYIPEVITSHSFGEYAGLVCSGIISFSDMFNFIFIREKACQDKERSGIMIVTNTDEKSILKIIKKDEFYFANYNSPKQTVIVADKNKCEKIKDNIKKAGFKAKILDNIPQPYHSPFMNDVKDKLDLYLQKKKIKVNTPEIKFYSSVIKKQLSNKNFNKKDIDFILRNQITEPVDFISSIRSIKEDGINNFIEIGPKPLYISFIPDILDEAKASFFTRYIDAKTTKRKDEVKGKKSPFFSKISEIIGRITGYEIEKISVEDKFQEDLGIDSIKKAEILLTVLDESNIKVDDDFSISDFTNISQVVDYIEKPKDKEIIDEEKRISSNIQRYKVRYIRKDIPDLYIESSENTNPIIVSLSEIIKDSEEIYSKIRKEIGNKRENIVIYDDQNIFNDEIENLNAKNEINSRLIPVIDFFYSLIKEVKEIRWSLFFITFNDNPFVCGLHSFFMSLNKELKESSYKNIQFKNKISIREMIDIIAKEQYQPIEVKVIYEKRKRYVERLIPCKEDKNSLDYNEDSIIVAFGGSKGITYSLIEGINKDFKPFIYLIGRSKKEDKIVSNNIKKLRDSNNNANVEYIQADAMDYNNVLKILSKIKNRHNRIDLLINGTGSMLDSLLKNKLEKNIKFELYNKILPSFNILKSAMITKPKRVINFTSIVSRYGNKGQTVYTCANEIINYLSEYFNKINKKTSSSAINWGPWDRIGMTSERRVIFNLKRQKIPLINPEKGLELFYKEITGIDNCSTYILDKISEINYKFQHNDIQKYKNIIGNISTKLGGNLSSVEFLRTFSLDEDSYLKDHKIKGLYYVPAAMGISMFACVARLYFDEEFIINNFDIKNPIILKDKVDVRINTMTRKNGIHMDISTNVKNYSCDIERSQDQEVIKRKIKKFSSEILINSLYSEYYFKDSIRFGPKFQNMHSVFLDTDNNFIIKTNNLRLSEYTGEHLYDRLIQWFDLGFQALGYFTLYKHRIQSLPSSIDKIRIFFNVKETENVIIIPEIKSVKGDVMILNDLGEVMMLMEGVTHGKAKTYDEDKIIVKKLKQ